MRSLTERAHLGQNTLGRRTPHTSGPRAVADKAAERRTTSEGRGMACPHLAEATFAGGGGTPEEPNFESQRAFTI